MKTINEQIKEIIINTVGVGLEGEYPYKIKLINVDQAAKEIVALKQQAEQEKVTDEDKEYDGDQFGGSSGQF